MVKIIIIGAGISGLSTYLFLRKHLPRSTTDEHEIKIYEAYDIQKSNVIASNAINGDSHGETDPNLTPQAVGGIGISRNGLAVLSRLDEDGANDSQSSIVESVALHGHPIERWEISTARGFSIAHINLAPKTNPAATKGHVEEVSSIYDGVMIARQVFWEMLRDKVLRVAPEVVVQKRIVDVTIGDESRPNTVIFEDGGREDADLVIGADGLRSVLRQAMFHERSFSLADDNGTKDTSIDATKAGQNARTGNGGIASWLYTFLSRFPFVGARNKKTTRVDKTDYITPHFEGLVGVGGSVPSSLLQSTGLKPGAMSIVFGPNGFFGYGYMTSSPSSSSAEPEKQTGTTSGDTTRISSSHSPTLASPGPWAGWWSTFSSPNPYPYSSGRNKPQVFDREKALAELAARHSSWKNDSIRAILQYIQSEAEREGECEAGALAEAATTATAPTSSTTPPTSTSIISSTALVGSFPTWTTPELPYWTVQGRAALVGDAAHALQPSSGQGACQALEDSEALALFLRHYLVSSSHSPSSSSLSSTKRPTSKSTADLHSSLSAALAAYEGMRMPRVHAIYVRSQKMGQMKGDMSFLAEWFMYLIIYAMSWFHDTYNEELLFYDLPAEVDRVIRERDGTESATQITC